MLIRRLALGLAFVSCNVAEPEAELDAPAKRPDPPAAEQPHAQHFCCKTVDPAKRTGEACVLISEAQAASCSVVLFCPGFYTLQYGMVTCPK